MQLQILKYDYFDTFFKNVQQKKTLHSIIENNSKLELPVDYFQFYTSVSSVYSSKIEGENIDFDSYYKYKFLQVKYQTDYTQKSNDLFAAYEFIYKHKLSQKNVQKAHTILSANLLPQQAQGKIRTNPMFVINKEDKIEYVAASPTIIQTELKKLFDDIAFLQETTLTDYEVFYFAAFIHLVFVKIHPFQDGNGRTSRLIEKWFLLEKLGATATAITLEKNYYVLLQEYYSNIKKIGLEYDLLNYDNAIDFLQMTIKGVAEFGE